jgi:hypothetical protein
MFGVAVLVVVVAVAAGIWLTRPKETVGHLKHWLGNHCTSVDHQHLQRMLDPRLPRKGVVSDDHLICNMLSGQVDVLRFQSTADRSIALRQYRRRLSGRTCVVGADELVVDGQLGGGHAVDFRDWCGRLHGRLFRLGT